MTSDPVPTTTLTVTIDLPAPPERVFAEVADLTRHPAWAANPLTITANDARPLSVGKTYQSAATVRGLAFRANLRVTVFEPPTRFGFAGDDATGQFTHLFTLAPHPSGTRVTRHITFQLTVRQWLMYWLLYYPVRLPAARQALAQLQKRLKSGNYGK